MEKNKFIFRPDQRITERARRVGLLNDIVFLTQLQRYLRHPEDTELYNKIEKKLKTAELENSRTPKSLIINNPTTNDLTGELVIGPHVYTNQAVKLSIMREIEKSNIMISGGSRTGKTSFIYNIVRQLKPYYHKISVVIFTQKSNLRQLGLDCGLLYFIVKNRRYRANYFKEPSGLKHDSWFHMPLNVKKPITGQEYSKDLEVAVCKGLIEDYGINRGSEFRYNYGEIKKAIQEKRYDFAVKDFKDTYRCFLS